MLERSSSVKKNPFFHDYFLYAFFILTRSLVILILIRS